MNLKTIRSVPFNLKSALDHKNFDLQWLESNHPDGEISLLMELGSSLYVEVWEQIIGYLHKAHNDYSGEQGKIFISQEARHNGYHKIINSRYIDPEYLKQPQLGRINATSYPAFMSRNEVLIREVDADKGNKKLRKALCRRVAAFETSLGLIGTTLAFERLEKVGPEYFAARAPYYYVWFYHYAEELEHLGEPFAHFENTFQEELWGPQNYADTLRDVHDATNETLHYVHLIAQKLNRQITIDDIMKTQRYVGRNQRIKEWLVPGWKLSDFEGMRQKFVKKWDEEWEPIMRQQALKCIEERTLVKAA